MLPVLTQPPSNCRRGDVSTGLLPQPSCCHLDAVTEVIVTERSQDGAEGIGLVAKCGGARREDTFARGAPPELHDLKFLLAGAATGEVVAAAIGARVRYFGGEHAQCAVAQTYII